MRTRRMLRPYGRDVRGGEFVIHKGKSGTEVWQRKLTHWKRVLPSDPNYLKVLGKSQ